MFRTSMLLILAWATIRAQSSNPAGIANTVAGELASSKYAEVYARFTPQMKAALPEAIVRTLFAQQLFAGAGDFEAVEDNPRCQPTQGVQACDVAVRFEGARVRILVALDAENRVGGLRLLGRELREKTPAALHVPARSISLPAYLTLPQTVGPHPLVVLVHGSGPLDADESVGPNKPFRDLAEGLAARGVATLRYDKRTHVSTSAPAANFDEEVIDDALAAVTLARAQEGVDPQRVFVLGHSLGGYLAPHIASRDAAVRGIVILAGNNRPMREILMEQVRHLSGSDAGFEVAWNSLPRHYREGLPNYDPLQMARQLPVPILVLQGARDYQVTTADYERWKSALSERTDTEFHLYPALNHLFLAGTGTSMPAEYNVLSHIPAEVLDNLAAWVKAH